MCSSEVTLKQLRVVTLISRGLEWVAGGQNSQVLSDFLLSVQLCTLCAGDQDGSFYLLQTLIRLDRKNDSSLGRGPNSAATGGSCLSSPTLFRNLIELAPSP